MYDNDLSSAKGQYSQIVMATGSDKALQLLGLCSNSSDGQHPNEIYLIAYLDGHGRWQGSSRRVSPGWLFTSFQAALGTTGHLEVVGLRLDKQQRAFLAAYQENSDWKRKDENFSQLSTRSYASFAMEMGSDGILQVVGIGKDDRFAYLVTQQTGGGAWVRSPTTPNNDGNLRPGVTFQQIAIGRGNDGSLQVLGVRPGPAEAQDGLQVWLAGFEKDKKWHPPYARNIGNLRTYWQFQSIATGSSPYGLLCIGLGKDGQAYEVATHNSNGWSPPDGQHSGPMGVVYQSGYSTLQIGYWKNNFPVVASLTSDLPYIVAYMRSSSVEYLWGLGHSLYPGDRVGSWNYRVISDVQRVYKSVRDVPWRENYDNVHRLNFGLVGHFQGMANYRHYTLVPHSRPGLSTGKIAILTKLPSLQVLRAFESEDGYNHPAGAQVIGDYFVIGVEKYDIVHDKGYQGVVQFYWLGCMTNESGADPQLLKLQVPQGEKGARRRWDHGCRVGLGKAAYTRRI